MNNILAIRKQLIIWIACAVIAIINIFLFFAPLISNVGELRNTTTLNTQKIASLKNTEAQNQILKQKNKFYRNEFFGISEKLPGYLAPEQFISALKTSASENKLKVTDISFTKPEEYDFPDLKPSYPTSGSLTQQADNIIAGFFAKDDEKGTKATDKELQLGNIPDEKAIKVDVGFSFSGSYDQTKGFVSSIESNLSNLSNMVIKDIAIDASNSDASIQGKITISLFGFKDSKIPVYNFWTEEIQRGKGNLFGKGAGTRYDADSTAISDFDISLNPYTSDLPSVIMRKHGTFTNAVFGDTKGIEQVQLQITEKGGQAYYRFKTSAMSYPQDYSYTPFKPVVSNNLFVKIYSRPRVGDTDNAGMNLTVIKPAGFDVKVQVYNDDAAKPRVTYQVK